MGTFVFPTPAIIIPRIHSPRELFMSAFPGAFVNLGGFVVVPGSQGFTAGTTSFTVPNYNSLAIWLKGGGGGGGGGKLSDDAGHSGSGNTGGTSQIVSLSLYAYGGTGGGGLSVVGVENITAVGAGGAAGAASGGDTNTTGGGAAGGNGGTNYVPNPGIAGRGGNGAAGGYAIKTYLRGGAGAPTPGSSLSFVIGSVGSGGVKFNANSADGSAGTAGTGNATWS